MTVPLSTVVRLCSAMEKHDCLSKLFLLIIIHAYYAWRQTRGNKMTTELKDNIHVLQNNKAKELKRQNKNFPAQILCFLTEAVPHTTMGDVMRWRLQQKYIGLQNDATITPWTVCMPVHYRWHAHAAYTRTNSNRSTNERAIHDIGLWLIASKNSRRLDVTL